MQDVEDLLLSLDGRGIKMWAEGGQLRIKARRGNLSEDELNGIRSRRAEILRVLTEERTLEDPIQPRSAQREIPLREREMRTWQGCLQEGHVIKPRLCTDSMRALGPLDLACLRESLRMVVQRHESLRTALVANAAGVPRQQINSSCDAPLQVFDLSRMDSSKAHAEVRRIAHEVAKLPVDVSVGPLFEACLFKVDATEHVLILVLDHAITDYVSIRIVVRELWDFYEQMVRRSSLELQPVLQFGDYAVWLQQTHNDWKRRHESYWRNHLGGAPYVRIPSVSPPARQSSPQPARQIEKMSFGERLTAELTAAAQRCGTSPSLVVLAIYAAVMSRWCDRHDLVIWLVSNGRFRPELENVTGHVACRLPLRIEVTRSDTFPDLLKRIEAELYTAESHRDFDRVPTLLPECRLNHELFFNWTRSVAQDTSRRIDGLKVEPFDFGTQPSPEFVPTFRHLSSGICAAVSYRPDLFARTVIERYLSNLRWFAQEFSAGRIPRWT